MPGTPESRAEGDLAQRVAELMDASVDAIEASTIPQPHRDLLGHSDGMTPTLEAYWKQPLHLRPLSMHRDGPLLIRQVVLVASRSHRPVGFGAIRIDLDRFPEGVRPEILASRKPLGAILRDRNIAHRNQLTGFFQVPSSVLARAGFDVDGRPTLYGRHNVLLSPTDEVLAEVVEVLPPVEADDGRESAA